MIDIFTTVTKSFKINKLHVFPLAIPNSNLKGKLSLVKSLS